MLWCIKTQLARARPCAERRINGTPAPPGERDEFDCRAEITKRQRQTYASAKKRHVRLPASVSCGPRAGFLEAFQRLLSVTGHQVRFGEIVVSCDEVRLR